MRNVSKGNFMKCSGWTVKTVEAVETKEKKILYKLHIEQWYCKFVNFMSEEAHVREPGPYCTLPL